MEALARTETTCPGFGLKIGTSRPELPGALRWLGLLRNARGLRTGLCAAPEALVMPG